MKIKFVIILALLRQSVLWVGVTSWRGYLRIIAPAATQLLFEM